jgi:uncharacterized RDD family membrane protein YckC
MTQDRLEPASPLKRFAAFCYDLLLLTGLVATFTLLAVLVRGGDAIQPGSVWYQTALALIIVAFFCGFWVHGGQTLGMRAWRIRVVTDDSVTLRWPRALLRFAAGLFAALPLGLGLWWGWLDPQRRGWHDRLAKTRVVRVTALRATATGPQPPA